MIPAAFLILLLQQCFSTPLLAGAFVVVPHHDQRGFRSSSSSSSSSSSLAALTTGTSSFDVSLPKPLGLILEENEQGKALGVFVKEVVDTGSAVKYASQIMGAKVSTVQEQNVMALTFDDVMDKIINAPDIVDISFILAESAAAVEEDITTVVKESMYQIGDAVTVLVKQDGKEDLKIDAKVGDNLRMVLLDSGFEVYQGLKQKLGNCGGGGQCTFCAMDVLDSDGWEERSEYEDKRLKKNPKARLACLNNIQGPLTVQKASR